MKEGLANVDTAGTRGTQPTSSGLQGSLPEERLQQAQTKNQVN